MKSLSRFQETKKKSLSKLLLSGVLGLSTLISSAGCITPTIPQVQTQEKQDKTAFPTEIKVPYSKIPRIPLEKELLTHIKKDKFSTRDAILMATGLNEWEYHEFQRTIDSRIKKIKQNPDYKKAKTIPEQAKVILKLTHGSRKYELKTSSIVRTMGGTGNCMGGTVYAHIIYQENGINVIPVLGSADAGKHIFLRLKHKGKDINLETTAQEGFDFKFTGKNKLNFEVEINKRQLLVEYLYNLARGAKEQKSEDLETAFYIASAKILPTRRNTFEASQGVRWTYGSDNEVKMQREIYALHPKSKIAQEVLARSLGFRGRKKDIREAISLMLPIVRKGQETNELKYEYVGMLYSKLKNYQEATKWYRKALKINPKSKETQQELKKLISKR